MNFLKRLFQMRPAITLQTEPILETLTIAFPDHGTQIAAVRTPRTGAVEPVIRALALSMPRPTLVILGGAGLMDSESQLAVRTITEDAVARFLQQHSITLIDGGTQSGIMLLMGNARQRRRYTFPLIGVAPEACIAYPGFDNPNKQADIDPFHSHLVLTDGDEFGAESEMIVALAHALSGKGEHPRLVMVINGGQIVRKEVYRVATREPRSPIVVLEGSGRFADELASAFHQPAAADPFVRTIVEQGMVYVLNIRSGAESVYRWLENFYGFHR